jgi:TolB-like protein
MQFRFENQSLDLDRRELRRGSELVALEPQVFDLLVYLVRNRDRLITKDDMITGVWGGRIVSESTLTSRINAARKAVADSGGEQRLIRTTIRKGFRFVGEVQEVPGTLLSERAAADAVASHLAARGKPTVAVLPFDNLSADPEQDYFSEGITEDIITATSRHRSILVVARGSAFGLDRKNRDVRQIGADLGASYVVQGSIRRTAQHVRITAQLVETTNGQHLWSEQYDRQVGQIFELQDEIASMIAARIEPEIGKAERKLTERKPPQAFEAWDYFRLGTKHFYSSTAADNREAQRLFRRAIELDPTMAEAYGFLAYAIVLSMIYFDTAPSDSLLEGAIAIAKKGVALDENDASLRFMYGRALLARGSYREALAELEIAAELNPNLAVVYCGLGDSLAYDGRIDKAIPFFERAISLSPHDPLRWAFYSYRALAHLFAGEFVQAEEWACKATRVPNCHFLGFAHRVAALGHLHSPDDLKTALAELRQANPAFTCKLAERRLFYVKNPQQVAFYLEGLRRAGVPEA